MKHTGFISTFLLLLAAASFAGCRRESAWDGSASSLEVRLHVAGLDTRTTSPGVASLGENDVNTVSLFLFGGEGQLLFRADGLTVSEGAASTSLPKDVLRGTSVSERTYTLCAVANGTVPASGISSIDDVLGTWVSASFDTEADSYLFPMYGTGSATLNAAGTTLTASIELRRSAAKIDVRIVDLADGVEGEGGTTWTPDESAMQITLFNAAKRGPAGGASYCTGEVPSGTLFSKTVSPLVRRTRGDSYYTTPSSFYSMASDWSGNESAEASFLLIVPWSADGGETYQRSYYQIPVNAAGLRIDANNYYVINMTIGVVGSFEEISPVTLTPSLLTLDWGTFDIVENEIRESRYLVLGSNSVTLDNKTETTIQFASSHDCRIYTKSMTYPDLSNAETPTLTVDESDYTLTVDNANSVIRFEHSLDNSGGAGSDFAPYTLTFTVGHSDNATYVQEVTIRQEPMIFVVADMNSDGDSSDHNGYVYINNGSKSSLGNGGNGLTGSNKNPSMYVISLSSFAAGSTYTIGDPRTSYIDNLPGYSGSSLSYTWAQTATAIEGGTRRISYYHPTEQGDRTRNMVAPKFRIASSYGACNAAAYNNMRQRCAAYQEDGFPAGRWRLPTAAEILYITSLSAQETIPELFTFGKNDTDGYWCANGWVGGDASAKPILHENSYSGSNYCRCVYDEWFWGSDRISDITTFTWGDVDY